MRALPAILGVQVHCIECAGGWKCLATTDTTDNTSLYKSVIKADGVGNELRLVECKTTNQFVRKPSSRSGSWLLFQQKDRRTSVALRGLLCQSRHASAEPLFYTNHVLQRLTYCVLLLNFN